MAEPPGRESPSELLDPTREWPGNVTSDDDADALAPSDAFGKLASEVRVTVLVELLSAERAGETPLSFSALHAAAPTDTSAGFAYHLRQLDGHFVAKREDGYVLTPAGYRAARAVVNGTFTRGGAGRAS